MKFHPEVQDEKRQMMHIRARPDECTNTPRNSIKSHQFASMLAQYASQRPLDITHKILPNASQCLFGPISLLRSNELP